MRKNSIAIGSWIAIAAAVLFGLTTPLIKHFGAASGPFATAALLYGGAALGAGIARRRAAEPVLTRAQAPRLLIVALFGAVLAPAALAWGLQRSGGLAGSLFLNLEAAFTVALAAFIYREPIGRRVIAACVLMLAAGGALALRTQSAASSSAVGLVALAVATFAWGVDNTLTRPLADFEPGAVVFWKGTLGATQYASLALGVGDSWPHGIALAALVGCGASGYGLSLRLYLRAQRLLGAARTGSLFALAPFVGAAVAYAMGDQGGPWLVFFAAVLFAWASYLHVTEDHQHGHRHEALDHEHAHTHDDGHHDHQHDPPVTGSHTHPHHHVPSEHDHSHGSDLHHRHRHE
jgi:drug/metabolite transporter (DMT)-like permease